MNKGKNRPGNFWHLHHLPGCLALTSLALAVVVHPEVVTESRAASLTNLHASGMEGMHHPGDKTHSHQLLEIPPGQPVPTVKLIVHPDAKQGWNLELQVTNFKFTPPQLQSKSNFSEGHAHLYLDGKKITRLYGSWYYLASLPPGQHQLKVTLNAHGHETLAYKGQPIQAIALVQVPAASQ
uniref:DUF4399 domain-containing protein n=1 Tax=Cyanothece sp. (strain PCC 7425 / ATCC 29141) TaxID=395961 RepID=B8HQR1_CYAP4